MQTHRADEGGKRRVQAVAQAVPTAVKVVAGRRDQEKRGGGGGVEKEEQQLERNRERRV